MDYNYIDYIELRLDSIKKLSSQIAGEIIEDVKEITSVPIILTNRSENEGGLNVLTEEERVKILVDNASLVEMTDIEYFTDEKLRQEVINASNKTIISYHNFEKTPSFDYLDEIVKESFKIGDIPKIALKPNNIEDTYTVLKLLMENKGIIAISMDDLGSYTRIIAPVMGAPVTYASITEESAPGQFDVKTTSDMIKKLKFYWLKMNSRDKKIIKSLNKLKIDTRFVSLYDNCIYINNLKFSKFSRQKEEYFHEEYPEIRVIRSKIFQKICTKVSRTVKTQIKPKMTLCILDNGILENILLYILLEPYKRKYGVKIIAQQTSDSMLVNPTCLDDFVSQYINLMLEGCKITEELNENEIYPLKHVSSQLIFDWAENNNIKYEKTYYKKDERTEEIIEFLEKHIPNVQESIKQSVNYLDSIKHQQLGGKSCQQTQQEKYLE